jgi:glycosyltransferase
MKISIVTPVFNGVNFISDALESLHNQTHSEVEHIIMDGASTDGTLKILRSQVQSNTILISEPDNGIYDALNKGFAKASGEIIGIMHSDDFFADRSVLADVAIAFKNPDVNAVYGDLQYVSKWNTKIAIRYWKAGECSDISLERGWMPPHPTLFLRRTMIERWGMFDTRFQISADYDLILRYFGLGKIRSKYLPRVLVKMRVGGISNRSLFTVLKKSHEDYTVIKKNGYGGVSTLFWKNLSKLGQLVNKENNG